jgi:hypothetical protein
MPVPDQLSFHLFLGLPTSLSFYWFIVQDAFRQSVIFHSLYMLELLVFSQFIYLNSDRMPLFDNGKRINEYIQTFFHLSALILNLSRTSGRALPLNINQNRCPCALGQRHENVRESRGISLRILNLGRR